MRILVTFINIQKCGVCIWSHGALLGCYPKREGQRETEKGSLHYCLTFPSLNLHPSCWQHIGEENLHGEEQLQGEEQLHGTEQLLGQAKLCCPF